MLIDMAQARARFGIQENLLAARTVASSLGNTVLCQRIDAALRSLINENLAPGQTRPNRDSDRPETGPG